MERVSRHVESIDGVSCPDKLLIALDSIFGFEDRINIDTIPLG